MSTQSTSVIEIKLAPAELNALLAVTRSTVGEERRADPRHPFFAPVTLSSSVAPAAPLSAFSREISLSGIGLLHAAPLKPGELFQMDLQLEGMRLQKTAKVMWCRSAGEGWYLSGCVFA